MELTKQLRKFPLIPIQFLFCFCIAGLGFSNPTNDMNKMSQSSTSTDISENDSTLRFVHAIWRHGDRSPIRQMYPGESSSSEDRWPQGFGELSVKGMQQHYQLGRYLRNRYDGFVSQKYSQFQIHATSSGYNRTLMSACANLAGFYETDSTIFHSNLSWFPIPVHSIEDSPIFRQSNCSILQNFENAEIKMPSWN